MAAFRRAFEALPEDVRGQARRAYAQFRYPPAPRVQFYAITVERRLKQPAVIAIAEGACRRLFAGRRSGAGRSVRSSA